MMNINFVDVGAAGKLEPPWKQKHINSIIRIDPFGKIRGRGKGKSYTYRCCAHKEELNRPFYRTRKAACSSLFKPNVDFLFKKKYDILDITQVSCRRLDSILDEHDQIFNVLKIDAQGGELDVLKGCGKYLKYFLCIHLEACYKPIYDGSPVFEEVDSFLVSNGFMLKCSIKENAFTTCNDFVYINTINNKQTTKIIKLYDKYITNIRRK